MNYVTQKFCAESVSENLRKFILKYIPNCNQTILFYEIVEIIFLYKEWAERKKYVASLM